MIEKVTAVSTIVTGFIVAYISYQQHLSQKQQLKIEEKNHIADLFDRRFKVFEVVQKELTKVLATATYNNRNLPERTQALQQSYFLFDDEIYTYVKSIRSKLMEASSLEEVLKDEQLNDSQRKERLEKMDTVVSWLYDELGEGGIFFKFKPYLRH